MAERHTLRRAQLDEAPAVMALLSEVVAWLRERGSDQWSTWQTWPHRMAPSFAAGDVWLLLDGTDLIGTITVENSGDPDFWTADERSSPAVYLSKMAVRRDHAGEGLGELLMAWAGDQAYRAGVPLLRLDAWRSNTQLHRYYLDHGWRYVRTVEPAGRHSGALFELDSGPMSELARKRLIVPDGSTGSRTPRAEPRH